MTPSRDPSGAGTSRRPGAALVASTLVASILATGAVLGATSGGAQARVPDASALTPLAPAAAAGCTTAGRVQRWPLHRLAEQTVVVPIDETGVAAASPEVAAGAGGLILFGSRAPANLGKQLARLVSSAPHGLAPVVMTDEEGGTVQRMADLVGAVPSARSMGSHWTPRHIHSVARHLGRRMRAAGVTMDLAPVLDLDGRAGPDADDAIGTRSFSPRLAVTTSDGLAFARGLRSRGVIPVVKHFPGMGSADGNTDLRMAATPPWREVRRHDLRPFRSAIQAGLPAVMVSNADVPGLTRLPATLSRAVVHRVLRDQLGFSGLVLPDSLTAGAVSAAGFDLPKAAVRALVVGEDMVLFTAPTDRLLSTTRRVVGAIVSGVRAGTLPRHRLESAVEHVLGAEQIDLCAPR